jgi:hypothetical protein
MRERKPSSVISSYSHPNQYTPFCCLTYTHKLELAARNVRDVHVVSRRRQIFQLLAREDVDGDDVDLGVAMLASLGGGHLDDLAWAVLDDDVAVLPQGRTLHREGGGGTGIGAAEVDFML